MMKERNSLLSSLQERIGYRFRDASLLDEAMRHSSFANEHRKLMLSDNERMEYLGDAVLELASSDYLFHMNPPMREGDMTRLRASLVCEQTLAVSAREIGLEECILLGRGEEATGGRNRDSIVSDALEALIGAIYLDGGFADAKEFVDRFVMSDMERKQLFYDSKTILQEIVQGMGGHHEIHYTQIGEEGPDHAKRFLAAVCIDGREIAQGSGSNKKSAEQKAAYQALILLKEKPGCI